MAIAEGEAPVDHVEPIKVAADAKLLKDVRALHHAWAKRVLIAPFEKGAEEAWKKDALAFVEAAVDDLAHHEGPEEARALAARGQKILEAGCRDPLVRYLTARLAYRQTLDAPATTKIFDELAKQIAAEHRYGAALLCFIKKDAFVVARSVNQVGRGVEKPVGDLLKKALADGSYGKDDDAVFVLHQMDAQWVDLPDARPAAFLEYYKNPALPEWARNTLQGFCEYALAWEARGGGWGSEVTEQGWTGFREHLAKAIPLLTEAWKQRPDQPYAAGSMIPIAMAGGGEGKNTVRLWFDRAVAAQFDYRPAYTSVLWADRPRWGGSHELMIAFGRACRDTGRFDTFVPNVFREAVEDVLSETDDHRAYLQAHPRLVRELMALDRDWIQHSGATGAADVWRTRLAIEAWCIGDFKTVREALEKLPHGLTLAPENLREMRASGLEIAADAALAGTDAGQARDAAEKAYAGGDCRPREPLSPRRRS